jgi:hypothetical protein
MRRDVVFNTEGTEHGGAEVTEKRTNGAISEF